MNKIINKDIGILIGVFIIITVVGFSQFVLPQFGKLGDKNKQIEDVKSKVTLAETTLRQKQTQQQPPAQANTTLPLDIYTTPYPDLDVENGAIELVDMVIKIIQNTGNRVVEISFTPSKCTEGIDNCNILTLSMNLDCSYVSFQKMLHEIYSLKYLTSIKNISLTFDDKNQTNLTGKLDVDLYVKKSK